MSDTRVFRDEVAVRRAVLGELRRRVDDIEDEACDELWGMDGYEDLTAPQREQVRAAVRRTVVIFVRQMESDGDELTDGDRHFFEQLGVSRAWSGVQLGHVKQGFDVGYRCAYGHLSLIAQASGEAGARATASLATRLAGLYRQAWDAIERGHRAAFRGGILPEEGDRRTLVTGILTGTADPQQLVELLGGSTSVRARRWDLVLVVGHPAGGDVEQAADDLLEAARWGAARGQRLSDPLSHVPVLVDRSPEDRTDDPLRAEPLAHHHGVTFVVARSDDACRLAESYRVVERHLPLVTRLTQRPGLVTARQLMRHAVLVDPSIEGAEWFIRDVLGAVLGVGSSRWDPLATLYALHDADGDVDEAAASVGLAARTVRGHLARITDLLGVDPTSIGSVYDMGVALRMLRVHADDLPRPEDAAWAVDRR